jgi:hypothetical protein
MSKIIEIRIKDAPIVEFESLEELARYAEKASEEKRRDEANFDWKDYLERWCKHHNPKPHHPD